MSVVAAWRGGQPMTGRIVGAAVFRTRGPAVGSGQGIGTAFSISTASGASPVLPAQGLVIASYANMSIVSTWRGGELAKGRLAGGIVFRSLNMPPSTSVGVGTAVALSTVLGVSNPPAQATPSGKNVFLSMVFGSLQIQAEFFSFGPPQTIFSNDDGLSMFLEVGGQIPGTSNLSLMFTRPDGSFYTSASYKFYVGRVPVLGENIRLPGSSYVVYVFNPGELAYPGVWSVSLLKDGFIHATTDFTVVSA